MDKKIDELKNMPSKNINFKEVKQIGSITGQVYHMKFKTKEEYNNFLILEEQARAAIIRLKSKM